MNKVSSLKIFIAFLFCPFTIIAQAYIFFNDSPNDTYYDPSFGSYSSPSVLVLAGGNKFPVDVNYKYSGTNALKLWWKSVSGGDWGISVAETGWIPHDVTLKDSITFRALSFSPLDSTSLPAIYLEDTQNAFPGKGHLKPLDEEIRRRDKEIATLKMERDILKKALAYFAKDGK